MLIKYQTSWDSLVDILLEKYFMATYILSYIHLAQAE